MAFVKDSHFVFMGRQAARRVKPLPHICPTWGPSIKPKRPYS